ncbi:MAG: tRNA (guanosine(46)-N7)-methyltransferase TrmB [Candidatus Sericytochromatia bacterium]|nr:tRNA (guanosine(46)-N7)-methyltransferase TrmB [Candidatus Sericytochromatia bacterium]
MNESHTPQPGIETPPPAQGEVRGGVLSPTTDDTDAAPKSTWRSRPGRSAVQVPATADDAPIELLPGGMRPASKHYVVNPYLLKIREMPEWVVEGTRLAPLMGQWHTYFQRKAPFWLEIGSCKGEYLTELSQRHPEVNLLGLEIKYKRTWRLGRLAKRLDLKHVRFAEAEGEAIGTFIAPGEIDRVIVNFPDPWEKQKEWKHRLFQPKFLDQLYTLMPPGGEIWFKTDHEGYFDWTNDLFRADEHRWDITFATRDLHHSALGSENIVTWFEALFTSHGLPTYAMIARRR